MGAEMMKNPKKPPSGTFVRRWEAVGMSRASWYRHGKPAEKPSRSYVRRLAYTRKDTGERALVYEFASWAPQREVAEELGVSVRTLQRDRAAIRRKVAQEIRKRRADGHEMSADQVEELLFSLADARIDPRLKAACHVGKVRQA